MVATAASAALPPLRKSYIPAATASAPPAAIAPPAPDACHPIDIDVSLIRLLFSPDGTETQADFGREP